MTMIETVLRLRQSYLVERGEPSSAVRIAAEDWATVVAELVAETGGCRLDQQRTALEGAVPLVDAGWRKGFPVCLDARGAADSMREGAHPPA